MALITWSDKYSVNIKEIDEQHQELIGLYNNLQEAYDGWTAKIVDHNLFRWFFNEFSNYVDHHFHTESALLKKYNNPAFNAHQEQHDELTTRLFDLHTSFTRGNLFVLEEIVTFLNDWLIKYLSNLVQEQPQVKLNSQPLRKTYEVSDSQPIDVLNDWGALPA